jgi:hypothetical protein
LNKLKFFDKSRAFYFAQHTESCIFGLITKKKREKESQNGINREMAHISRIPDTPRSWTGHEDVPADDAKRPTISGEFRVELVSPYARRTTSCKLA